MDEQAIDRPTVQAIIVYLRTKLNHEDPTRERCPCREMHYDHHPIEHEVESYPMTTCDDVANAIEARFLQGNAVDQPQYSPSGE